MVEQWIPLSNLPATGREFSFDNQNLWMDLWKEFHFEAEILAPIEATLYFTSQSDGFLIQGRLAGSIKTSCHRCMEDASATLDHEFDTYEAHDDASAPDDGEGVHIRNTDAGWELNIAGLLWEEFLLAMPEKILCADTCLGLCPQCGKNRNLEHCVCSNAGEQSPLARALQGVKIKTN